MSFLQFPSVQYFRIFRGNEPVIRGGKFDLSKAMELKHCMVTVVLKGQLQGSERLRMEVYGSNTSSVPIFVSDWAELSGVGAYATSWIGNIYLDFPTPQPINPASDYFFRFRIENYTRDGDSRYVGVNLDWVSRVNATPENDQAGARIRLIGLRDVNQ
jgi:hypothetical protein